MKTIKKLLVVLVALLLISSATVVAVFASDPTPGNLTVAGQYMSNIGAATNPTDKMAAITAYDEYMATHTFPTDPVSELNYNIIVESATAAKVEFTKENIEIIKANVGYQAAGDPEKENVAVANYQQLLSCLENLYFMKDSEEYLAFKNEFDAKMAQIKVLYDARIAANYTAPFGEYDYPKASEYDFEISDTGSVKEMNHANFEKADPQKFQYGYKQELGAGSNGSMGYYYESTAVRTGDPYANVSGFSAGGYPGIVLEFDYYHVPGASLALSRGSISINGTTSTTTEYGTFKTASYTVGHSQFTDRSGWKKDSAGKWILPSVSPEGGVLVENSWNRIAIALNAETGEFKAYANYQFLTSYRWTGINEGVEFNPTSVRFKYTGAEMRLDNIHFYYGTQPRILDRFEQMSDEERFLMYNEVIHDDEESFVNRDGAYTWMSQNIGFFYDEFNQEYIYGISDEVKAAVDAYLAFDYAEMKITDHVGKANDPAVDYETRIALYDDVAAYLDTLGYIVYEVVDDARVGKANVAIIGEERTGVIEAIETFLKIDRAAVWAEFLEQNMEGLKEIYNALAAIDDKTVNTITERDGKLSELQHYIDTVTSEKLPQGKELTDILNAMESIRAKIEFDTTALNVQQALTSFLSAPTYEAQKKWADRVEQMIYIDGVSIFEDLSKLRELETMKVDYDNMSVKITEKTIDNNSKKIVLSIRLYREYVLSVMNDEIKAQTPVGELPILMKFADLTSEMLFDYIMKEKAAFDAGEIEEAATWEYVRTYAMIAARAIKEGYREDYDGVALALEYNKDIYAYFYNLLQQDHVQHLSETLSRYDSAQTYVDKLGVCTYIENYIMTQDIDTSREDVQMIMNRVKEIRESLTKQEDGTPSDVETEYLEALKANTKLFIAAVDGMLAARDKGYEALYNAWQEALKYYYFMEITSEDVKAAIAEYVVLEKQLIDWQTNSDLFIEAVGAWNTEEMDAEATYSALASAYALKELSNGTYPGIADAMATYEAVYAAYNAPVSKVNAEMLETVDLAFAVRKPYTALDVIASFFKKIFA